VARDPGHRAPLRAKAAAHVVGLIARRNSYSKRPRRALH
jgi:hypothetical protein